MRSSLLISWLSLGLAAPVLAAPPTAVETVRETLHGVELADPYRWLEGSDAPEIGGENTELDTRVSAWTDTQNAATRKVLDALPGRAVVEGRLRRLLEAGEVEAPVEAGGRYFYRARSGEQAQRVLMLREGVGGEPRVLLDPARLDPEGLTAIDWLVPSHDGELVAFGLYRGGDERPTLYVMRVDGGEWLAEEIPGRVEAISWLPDSSGFFYRRLADVDNPYSARIQFHPLGRHHRQDPVIFEQYKEGPLATTFGPYVFTDHQARWLGLIYFTGIASNDLWVYDLEHWRRTGKLEKIDVIVGEPAQSIGPIVGDTLFLNTTLGAPNGRVMAVDLRNPARERWREIIPERSGAVIESMAPAKGLLAVHYLEKASTRIEIFHHDGSSLGPLALPGLGSASLTTNPETTEAFLSFESFQQPESIYRLDLASDKRSLWASLELEIDPEKYVVEQVFYPSKDGAKVSMFLIHRKGLAKNGKIPTILHGYGGFNVPETAKFSAQIFPWIEAGGLFAVANLRGGGEYGEAWHRAGMLEKKQNVFDDFIAAAEWLIANGYTSSQHLGLRGGSNGGLLTGAVLVQRPELVSAVLSAVPLLDMLRYQDFLMARYWIPEYGTAENPEQFRYLRAYSPYHNVKDGVKYPAVLLTAGENDARVHPLHARKMAARLQAATGSDPSKEPILLWVERDAGHGQGKPMALQLQEAADVLLFMGWQLGLTFG